VTNLDPADYDALREIAARQLRHERRQHTLRPTDLVHEAWLRLEQAAAPADSELSLRLRAARTMRQVLVDHARRRVALRRGVPAPLADDVPAAARDAYVVDLDGALAGLAELAPDVAQVVELRFFGGCSVEEAAEVLGLSPRTVKRRWQLAKAWLHREITR
jgi:RNA polymerase sigma factor (TIGR02999 family)